MISHFPFGVVRDFHVVGQLYSFRKVYEPHVGIVGVMNKQQRASNNL